MQSPFSFSSHPRFSFSFSFSFSFFFRHPSRLPFCFPATRHPRCPRSHCPSRSLASLPRRSLLLGPRLTNGCCCLFFFFVFTLINVRHSRLAPCLLLHRDLNLQRANNETSLTNERAVEIQIPIEASLFFSSSPPPPLIFGFFYPSCVSLRYKPTDRSFAESRRWRPLEKRRRR